MSWLSTKDEAQPTPPRKHSQNILLFALPASSLVFSVAMMSTVAILEFSKSKTIAFQFHTFPRPKQGQDSNNTPSSQTQHRVSEVEILYPYKIVTPSKPRLRNPGVSASSPTAT